MSDAKPTPRPARARSAAAPISRAAASERDDYPGWRWRTFPVFAAFVAGLLLAFIVNEGSVNPVAFVLQLLAILGVGYVIAHFFVANVIVAGRVRRRRDAIARGETPDDEMEDVVVYEDAN